MQHAFRGSRRLFAFLLTGASIALVFAVFSAGGSARPLAKHRARAHPPAHHSGGSGHHSGGFSVTSVPWGTADGGQSVSLYTLSNGHRMSVNITNYGGVVQSISVPARSGGVKDVALGFSSLSDYVDDFTQGATGTPWPLAGGSGDTYFGAIIGRYANRIANHSFTMTCSGGCSNNGKAYTLDANNGVNTLHGGYLGWNTAVWSATPHTGPGGASLVLTATFPDGEGCLISLSPGCNGFPAAIKATVTYTLTGDNALKIHYNAVNTSSSLATS